MPIPIPPSEHDLGTCIRFLRKEGKPADQCVAICLDIYRRSKGKEEPKGK